MRKVLDIIDGDEYYGVQYPRSSNGDLCGVGDNDLSFLLYVEIMEILWILDYGFDLRSFMRFFMRILV